MTPASKHSASCVFLIKEVRESKNPLRHCQEPWFTTACQRQVVEIYRNANHSEQYSKEGETLDRTASETAESLPEREGTNELDSYSLIVNGIFKGYRIGHLNIHDTGDILKTP